MDAVPSPISIPVLLSSILQLINDLQRRNVTMINYYIYPSPTPTEIAEYEPRLLIYRNRIQGLAQLSLAHTASLVDDALALIASFMLPSISAVAASSQGFQIIFIEHYDRRLEQSRPYDTIHDTLRFYEQSLQQFIAYQRSSPHRQPAEAFVPASSSTLPSLCRGATAFLNNRDHGKVSSVLPDDLLPQHKGRLADKGGVVLWWECPVCAFKLRYHASNSANLNINTTDEILIEDSVEDIAYRSAWLVKCHIYHARQAKPATPPTSPPPKPKNPDPAPPKPKPKSNTTAKRLSFTRRKSTSTYTKTTTIVPGPPSPTTTKSKPTASKPAPAPGDAKSKSKPKKPTEPAGPLGLRYYCPFCIARGKSMVGPPPKDTESSSSSSSEDDHPDPTCFEDSKELIEHIDDKHTRDRPVNLMLQKLKVAVKGEMGLGPEGRAARWDLDLR